MNELTKIIDKVFPLQSLELTGVHYNHEHNMLVSNGYTSYAGNTYFHTYKLSERLLIIQKYWNRLCSFISKWT